MNIHMKLGIARRCSTFLALTLVLSSVMACSMETPEELETPTPAQSVPPVETDTTTPATGDLTSGGSADGLICTLCRAQGCDCWRSQCINCGLKAP